MANIEQQTIINDAWMYITKQMGAFKWSIIDAALDAVVTAENALLKEDIEID